MLQDESVFAIIGIGSVLRGEVLIWLVSAVTAK